MAGQKMIDREKDEKAREPAADQSDEDEINSRERPWLAPRPPRMPRFVNSSPRMAAIVHKRRRDR
jgi:hypothetical protein